MRIVVGPGRDDVALAEPDDLTRFHVEVDHAVPADALPDVVHATGIGHVDGDGVAVAPHAIRRLAGVRPAAWERDLEAMIAFAAQRGWVTDDGYVRAHVEWTADEEEQR
ncbi:MAG: hypothetical protein M0P31_13115 [Solirubrobacteraceae bacterium]|nr:hypothetical protein [Solirubrobacteraceae bacterium]